MNELTILIGTQTLALIAAAWIILKMQRKQEETITKLVRIREILRRNSTDVIYEDFTWSEPQKEDIWSKPWSDIKPAPHQCDRCMELTGGRCTSREGCRKAPTDPDHWKEYDPETGRFRKTIERERHNSTPPIDGGSSLEDFILREGSIKTKKGMTPALARKIIQHHLKINPEPRLDEIIYSETHAGAAISWSYRGLKSIIEKDNSTAEEQR